MLGFGGSLLGSTSPSESRALLQAAYGAGIRHFDVAPMYGFGRSESLLRAALGINLQNVTITSKYGLAPPPHSGWRGPIHRFARATLSAFPAVKRKLQARAAANSELAVDPPLTALAARKSLEASLQALGVDALDLFLLHEATPARLGDPDLLPFLQQIQQQGFIRQFGVGSRSERVLACLNLCPQFCPMVQFEWSALVPTSPVLRSTPRIVHGSLGTHSPAFSASLLNDPARCDAWSTKTGVDLRAEGMISRLLLKASLMQNAGHIVLFSTRSQRNIERNVRTAEDATLASPAAALVQLIREKPLT